MGVYLNSASPKESAPKKVAVNPGGKKKEEYFNSTFFFIVVFDHLSSFCCLHKTPTPIKKYEK